MRFVAVLVAALLLTSDTATGQRPSGALTPQIESILRGIKAADKGQLAESEEDGRFLRVLVATRGAKSILEIGAASGYSGIWLGLGARESGGRVCDYRGRGEKILDAGQIVAGNQKICPALQKAIVQSGYASAFDVKPVSPA